MKKKKSKCVICQRQFTEYSNSAYPVADGPCCDKCDNTVVTPARIALRTGRPVEDFEALGRAMHETIKRFKARWKGKA